MIKHRSATDIVRESLFFDEEWYYGQYPDVRRTGADAAEHYVRYGAAEGRDPGPCFSTKAYLRRWPEAIEAGLNPLVHFSRVADFVGHDVEIIRSSGLFEAGWYLEQNPDVRAAGVDPLEHYVRHGAAERRDPTFRFSTLRYLEDQSDIQGRSINPFAHAIRRGIESNRSDEPAPPVVSTRATDSACDLVKLGRKAVFVTHDLNIGGAPKLLLSIARWFQRSTDYDVRIVAMANGPLYDEAAAIAPVHIVGTLAVADAHAAAARESLRLFVGDSPAFTFVNSAAAGHFCKIDPFLSPVFAYIHELRAIAAHYEDQLKMLLHRADHVFCGGSGVAEFIRQDFPEIVAKVSTRPSFIERPLAHDGMGPEEKARRRLALGLSPDRKLVIGCGVAHWRKQPLMFVRLAGVLIAERGRDVDFAWVGDGEDVPAMRDLVAELGIADRFHFLGHQEDVRPFIAAADVFALTSSEDPFPLVCLEAGAACTPVVVFREATAFSDLIEDGGELVAGAAVPLNDELAFARSVDEFLQQTSTHQAAAAEMRRRVLRSYTVDIACSELLVTIRKVAKLAPRVSIIVPTYNSATYLRPRLESLSNQTFRDVEILMFDDASTDNSWSIIEAFAETTPLATAYLATSNSGSVFKAWERGIKAANGDFIWLAEADDWCDSDFLKIAVAAFAVSGVRLVHGRSIPVDQRGNVAGDWNDLYLDAIVPGLWRSSFVSPALKEINRSLGRANTIVNASGVLVRRGAALNAIEVASTFKLAGDWAFYVIAAYGGRIAYSHEAINYHRRHDLSVTASVEGTFNYFQELMNVGAIVRALYGNHEARDAQFRRHIEKEATRFSYASALPDGFVPATLKLHGPAVLYGVGDLSGGGAQMFAVRFVNRWLETKGPAVLFVAGHDADHHATLSKIDPLIPLVGPAEIEAEGGLKGFLSAYGLDVVLTGHWWADLAIGRLQASEETPAPWVIVMHGCYESVLESTDGFPGYQDHLARAEQFASHWVWTAPKNRKLFDDGHVRPKSESQIINGFDPVAPSDVKRLHMGIPNDAVVFTIASRALESKGWLVALEAYRTILAQMNALRDVRLLLIGDGPAAEEIRGIGPIHGVTMVAHTDRLADYIAVSDVLLLPSWFVGESLPLTLLEFLAQGKPAVVSDIGLCGWAIGEGTSIGPAGIVVERRADGVVHSDDLASAMLRLTENDELRRTLAGRAKSAFQKFSMEDMIDRYDRVLRGVIASAHSSASPGSAVWMG